MPCGSNQSFSTVEVRVTVRIRMKRVGTKKRPAYRIVVAESSSPRDGRNVEIVGNYNPMVSPHQLNLRLDRVDHWIANGALPSRTVQGLIRKARRIESGDQVEIGRKKAKPSAPVKEEAAPAEKPVEAAASAPATETAAAVSAPEAASSAPATESVSEEKSESESAKEAASA